MIGLSVAVAGALLLAAGLIVLFGAWAAVVCGVLLIAAGVLVDFDRVGGERAKHPAAAPVDF